MMGQAASPSIRIVYSLARVLRTWEIARSTFYARKQCAKLPIDRTHGHKRGPQGPCDDETLLEKIRELLAKSSFHGEGHRKVWAKLRVLCAIRTSKDRVLRLMRENNLLAPTRVGHKHGPKGHEGTILTEVPNRMWGTDMTGTVTVREGKACVFVAVDHCTLECTGIHAAKVGTRFEALEPLRQGVREHFGGFAHNVAVGLCVRHDHGSAYLSDDFQNELTFLGAESSPSFVREPEGNGCAEWFIRILKENLLWVRSFETVEELRQALLEFKEVYNTQWLIERHGYRTPVAMRQVLSARQETAA